MQQTVLEGHKKFLEKLSPWVLKCKFYEYSGQVNVPGIGGKNRWEWEVIKNCYTLSYIIKGIIKNTADSAEVNNNVWMALKETVAEGQISNPEALMRSKHQLSWAHLHKVSTLKVTVYPILRMTLTFSEHRLPVVLTLLSGQEDSVSFV